MAGRVFEYLKFIRNFLVSYIARIMPDLRTTLPDTTYLAWLDCNALVRNGHISISPYKFFLKKTKVTLNNGSSFDPGGEGFVRFNFSCPRNTMLQALQRMKAALEVFPSA